MRDAPWIEMTERYGTDYVCYWNWGYWPNEISEIDKEEEDE